MCALTVEHPKFKIYIMCALTVEHPGYTTCKVFPYPLVHFKYTKGTQYSNHRRVFKMLMTLSHGQAAVERGYSRKEDLLGEIMTEKTVVT